jgi:hypothetical protein
MALGGPCIGYDVFAAFFQKAALAFQTTIIPRVGEKVW